MPVSRSIFSINSSDPNGRQDEIVLRIFVNVSRLLRLASSDSYFRNSSQVPPGEYIGGNPLLPSDPPLQAILALLQGYARESAQIFARVGFSSI
jgi:hypothetical protein